MFKNLIFSSAIAGVLAALVLTLTQALWVTPLILKAETFELAAESLSIPEQLHPEHQHEETWAPEDGWQRTLSTAVSNSLLGTGFALMLSGLYAFRRPQGIKQGMAWGLAGFAVFFAAPGLGLPPELPGTTAAELTHRQEWWLATAISTATGLGLIFFQKRWLLHLTGIAVLIAPHVIGAPHPMVPHSAAPESLQVSFRIATLGVNATFWIVLGALSAFVYQRITREATR